MSDAHPPAHPSSLEGFSLFELCQRGALEEQFIIACVECGVADAVGGAPPDWVFTATAALRIRKAWRVHRELDVHVDSLALVLELLDERDALRQEVAVLRQRLQQWEGLHPRFVG